MEQYFWSNGKLLLTAEYAILNGATALAIPVKYGQSLIAKPIINSDKIYWYASENNNLWYKGTFLNYSFIEISNSENTNHIYVSNLLKAINKLNPQIFKSGWELNFNLTFNKNWGLGSSSTLINNVAQWAHINPFKLNSLISQGSGYDIACAQNNSPILYKLLNNTPEFSEVTFNPEFKNCIYFIYSGQKQATNQSVNEYLKKNTINQNIINQISNITNQIITCKNLTDFCGLITEHELLIAQTLHVEPLKNQLFSDFNGCIKSLGAWGGDFFMAATEKGVNYVNQYFKNLNINTVIPFDEMIINK